MTLPSLQECAAGLERLAPSMLIIAAGSVLVLGLAGLAALATRRASSSARHEVWLLGFAGVILLPVLSAVLPGWHVLPRIGASGHVPRPADSATEVAVLPYSESAPDPALHQSTTKKETIVNTMTESPSSSSPRTAAVTPAIPSLLTPIVSRASGPEAARVARTGGVAWTVWVMLCWAVGSFLVLCRVGLGHLSLWSLRRRCAVVTRGELFDLLARLRKELGVRRHVELLSSPARTMPMTWGLWRARLLVPEQAAEWPSGQRRDVLLHELGHVSRWDCLTQFLSQVACALYWFNPLAWVASHRMQVERERACDDLVLSRGVEAPAYARHLLQSVSSVPALRLAGAAVAMARPSTLEERMRAILDPHVSRRGLTARGSVATILLLLSALVPVAALKAQQLPPDAPPVNRGSALPGRIAADGSVTSPATRPTTRPGLGGRFGGRGGQPLVLGEGPTCTFDATIYDMRLPIDQIGKLDAGALTKASESVEGFEKALAALGTAKPMYRADQSVRLAGDTLNISSQTPVVTSTTTLPNGHTASNYQYMSVGALFSLAGKAGTAGGSDMDLNIQVASLSDTLTVIGNGVTVPVVRSATLSHKGVFHPGKPFVLVSVDASSTDKEGKAVAYVARVIVGEPQPGATR